MQDSLPIEKMGNKESQLDIYKHEQDDEEAMRSDEPFRSLIESAPIGIGISRDLQILYVNRAYQDIFGYDAAEMPGKCLTDVVPPDLRQVVCRSITDGERNLRKRNYETTGKKKDGTIFPLSIAACTVDLPDGPATICFMQDISERKKAEEELARLALEQGKRAEAEAARQQLSDILDSITDAFYALNREGRLTYVNKRAERFSGRRREELIGKKLDEAIPHLDDSEIPQKVHAALTEQRPIEFTSLMPALGRWVRGRACPAPDGLTLYLHDITGRKQAEQDRKRLTSELEQAARAARQRSTELQFVLDNMMSGVLVSDTEGRITLANARALRLMGKASIDEINDALLTPSEFVPIRRPDGTLIKKTELPLFRALAGEEVEFDDQVFYSARKDKNLIVRASAAPIRDQKGKIAGAVEVMNDVTRLSELDRLKDQFIRVTAHELKTPLTVVKGYAQALLRSPECNPPEKRKVLNAIDHGADRMNRIVEDLLDISRLQLGDLQISMEEVDLAETVSEVVRRMALKLTTHVIRLSRTAPAVVRGDHLRLEQVVINLIDNAIKHSPGGGDIDVAVEVRDGEAVVSVRDHGVGIPKDKQSRIFERFYRAHTDTPYDYGGIGVGLFLSKEIISKHGGRMWFESVEGKGSHFHFSLPLRQAVT